jgi:amino acid adenylation domain-containing protein
MMNTRSGLSPAKEALLEQRLKGRPGDPATGSGIPQRPHRSSAPQSFAQRQMWVIDRMAPGNRAYNQPNGYRLRGALHLRALQDSFNEIIRRHEGLRTTFADKDGEPLQIIHPELKIAIKMTALDHLAGEARENRLHVLASEEAVRPFDLSHLPLIRVSLFKLDETEHVLLINLHHIVADGLSVGLMLQELDAFYRAFTGGGDPHPPALTVQYADFAHWQRHAMTDDAYTGQIEFWRKQLQGKLPVLELPADMPRPPFQSFLGSNVFFRIPKALAEDLRSVGAGEECTFFMTMLAAFQALLHRYSGAEDVIIGTPVATRSHRQVEPLIGNFLNMVALRGDLSGDPTFVELLRRSRNSALDAFSNSDLPFEGMVNNLKFNRDSSRNPVFQAMLQVLSTAAPRIGDLEVRGFDFDLKYAQCDLSLHLYEESGGYGGRFEYCTELFRADTVERMSSSFEHLLNAIVGDPQRKISELSILAEGERKRILDEWNATSRDYGVESRLHRLFEAQVGRTPGGVALGLEGRELTYAQVNERANRLARVLRAKGVGPGVLVGVIAERSFEMVVSLLAILKAGGAYVPLDPSYPGERLRHMLEDAQARLVLAQPHLVSQLPGAAQVLELDASWAAYAGEAGGNLEDAGTPEDLAYVIFTSGSTGRPKGGMNAHRGICNRLLWMQEEYGLTAEDRVLQKTPFSFDVSVWEFFWPLLTGARLVIARPEGHRDSAYLVRLIRESGITTMHFVPSMMRVFLEEQGVEVCSSLRRVICSGEALPHELQERFFARLPEAELHNLYGPTEAAVDVTYWACRRGDERLTVPIGHPVANTQIYVLDARMRPVPVGVPGELYIGGVQVGRGYVGRPELTAERFAPDPFSKTPGARLYRTGDSVRYLADGAIEYLGRLDHQVKIRGQRIELGEIEAVLAEHSAVRQAAVHLWQVKADDVRIVACCVPAKAGVLAPISLRKHLRARLPEYMIPQYFLPMDEIPLLPNGKVDRRRLPKPVLAESGVGQHEAPADAVEAVIAEIWTGLIQPARPIGRNDRFFEMGGHSLLGLQALGQMEQRLGVRLDFRVLLQESLVEIATRFRAERVD